MALNLTQMIATTGYSFGDRKELNKQINKKHENTNLQVLSGLFRKGK